MEARYDFGLVGLGVMGRNFILNVAQNKFAAIGLDKDPQKVAAMDQEAHEDGYDARGTVSATEFVQSLKSPRVIMMLVPAGAPVDSVIQDLLPLLSAGDLLIDGGNSFYTDTDRRKRELSILNIHFMGAGVSGGSKGARFGPSIMPGGSPEAWTMVKPIFEAVAAKANGEPCVAYIGPGSAGNYVKMVHNGIEYGMMQLISEAYDIMGRVLKMSNYEMAEVFRRMNEGKAQSYLIEITSKLLSKKDDLTDENLVSMILDKGKQKGTGKWTSQNAMDLGVPLPTVDMAVCCRELSAYKSERLEAEKLYTIHPEYHNELDKSHYLYLLEEALYFSFIMSYAQGMAMLTAASDEYNYNLNLGEIPRIWRAGCIIRSSVLFDISDAYRNNPGLKNMLLAPQIVEKVLDAQWTIRRVLKLAMDYGVPAPCMAASLSYFDSYRTGRSSMNLIQAQRDFFGSHTYERTDREGIFHTEWE